MKPLPKLLPPPFPNGVVIFFPVPLLKGDVPLKITSTSMGAGPMLPFTFADEVDDSGTEGR